MSADVSPAVIADEPAIEIEDLYYNYGFSRWKFPVLKGITLNVPAGTIYGLLGPSGCGKTTLLKCVTGTLKPASGMLKLFGKLPGSKKSGVPGSGVGYMPQEIALCQELTITETLEFFGRVHFMKRSDVKSRTEFLLNFLNLPRDRKLIKNLSGGQQRRVSFAVALLHEPPLLILDEPTVGVDPVLRLSIWEYLLETCLTGSVTVIITTHYIEEARKANNIGLMRKGKILAGGEPSKLIQQYKVSTLEEVFFHLCQSDRTESYVRRGKCHTTITASLTHVKVVDTLKCSDYCSFPSIRRINAMAIKNLLKMWRTLILLVFQFLSPAIQVSIFCLSIGGDPHFVNVAVLNEDKSLGVKYLNIIDKNAINLIPVKDAKEAEEMVLNGDAWAVISIGPNFTAALLKRLSCPTDLSLSTMEAGNVHVRFDYSDKMILEFLQKTLHNAFQAMSFKLQEEIGKYPVVSLIPIQYDKPIYGSSKSRFLDYLACGLVLSLVFFLALGLTALAFVTDKKEGLLDRCFVSGITSLEIMCGHIITQFGVMAIQVCIILLLVIKLFQVTNDGSIFLIVALCLLQGMCGMTYGFLISTICNAESSAMMLAIGSFYPFLLLSGTIWPIQAMPTALQKFSMCLPQTLAMKSLRWIMTRGCGITWVPVYTGFLVTGGWILFFITVSIIVLTFKFSK